MQFITEHRIPANSQTDRPPLHLDIQLPCLFWSSHPPYRCSSGLDKYMECQSPNTGAAYESGQYALQLMKVANMLYIAATFVKPGL